MMIPLLILLCLALIIRHNAFHPIPFTQRVTSRPKLLMSESDIEYVPTEVERCDFTGRGCVLLAQQGEHDHFLYKNAVLIYEHSEKGTAGVILGKASAFSLGETAPGMPTPFHPNALFIGGDHGEDMALMFHKYDFEGMAKPIGNGLFIGGMKQAREALEDSPRRAHPRDFKFIFNCVQWPPGSVEKEVASGRWDCVRMPPEQVLEQKDYDYIWSKARRAISPTFKDDDEE